MRKYYRSIARARMIALGVDRINKPMKNVKSKMAIVWRRVLWGDFAKEAMDAQFRRGKYAKKKPRRKSIV